MVVLVVLGVVLVVLEVVLVVLGVVVVHKNLSPRYSFFVVVVVIRTL